jgi:hypothetical protein
MATTIEGANEPESQNTASELGSQSNSNKQKLSEQENLRRVHEEKSSLYQRLSTQNNCFDWHQRHQMSCNCLCVMSRREEFVLVVAEYVTMFEAPPLVDHLDVVGKLTPSINGNQEFTTPRSLVSQARPSHWDVCSC